MYRFLTIFKRWQFPIQALCVLLMGLAAGQFGGWIVRAILIKDLQVPPETPKIEVKDEDSDRNVPFQFYSSITERNLFGVDVSVPATPNPTDPSQLNADLLAKSHLSLELMGTIAGSEKNSLAVIRAKANQNVDTFRVGESVFNQATVLKIERMRVILDRNGKQEVLELKDDDKAGGSDSGRGSPVEPITPSSPSDVTAGGNLEVREKDDNVFEIDRAGFEEVVSDLAPLLTQARVVPHFEDGKLVGYKIFAIKQQSVYEKIGLRNGDVLTSINGNVIDDPTKAMQLLTQLKTEDEFKIDLVRGGKPSTFRYNLR